MLTLGKVFKRVLPTVTYTRSKEKGLGSYDLLLNAISIRPGMSVDAELRVLAHELTHWYQWNFIYQHDSESWCNDRSAVERVAHDVSDIVYEDKLGDLAQHSELVNSIAEVVFCAMQYV